MPHEREVLDRRPPCDPATTICVEAWHDLGTERQLGYGVVGMIPRSKTFKWARDTGLDRDNSELLWAVIQFLDGHRAEREASKARNNGGRS